MCGGHDGRRSLLEHRADFGISTAAIKSGSLTSYGQRAESSDMLRVGSDRVLFQAIGD